MVVSPTLLRIIGSFLGTSGIAIWRMRKTIRELHKKNEGLVDIAVEQHAQIAYLLDVLDRNEVEMTEFDAIALKILFEEGQKEESA